MVLKYNNQGDIIINTESYYISFPFIRSLLDLMDPFPIAGRIYVMSIPEILSESLNWYQYTNDEERTSSFNGSSFSIMGRMDIVEACN